MLDVRTYPGTGAWYGVGSDDRTPIEAIARLAPASRAADIETCVDEIPGNHTFVTFGALLRSAFPWLMRRLGLSSGPMAADGRCEPGSG